jgi:hypothetical protein
MSNPVPDTQPEPEEVLQTEEIPQHIQPVPVTVEGPLRAQLLPAPLWSAVTLTLNTDEPQQIFGAEPRRRRACIQLTAATCWIAPTREGAESEFNAFRLSATTSFIAEFFVTGELWIKRDSGNPVVACFQEFWTE